MGYLSRVGRGRGRDARCSDNQEDLWNEMTGLAVLPLCFLSPL